MDDDKTFTVRDRRKFTSDGALREQTDEVPETPAETPREEPIAARPTPAPPQPQPAELPGETGDDAVDFAGFLVSLASQASMLLSTDQGDLRENLQGARHLIGVLEMLEERTRGRRTPEEDQLLEQILYELRVGFVERSRRVGA